MLARLVHSKHETENAMGVWPIPLLVCPDLPRLEFWQQILNQQEVLDSIAGRSEQTSVRPSLGKRVSTLSQSKVPKRQDQKKKKIKKKKHTGPDVQSY